eukprot:2398362-Prymnesium_polylepis.1
MPPAATDVVAVVIADIIAEAVAAAVVDLRSCCDVAAAVPVTQRVAHVAAAAAEGGVRGLVKVAEQRDASAALHVLAVGLHLPREAHVPLLAGAAAAAEPRHLHEAREVGRSVEEHALGGLAVAARAARLLVVALERLGHR